MATSDATATPADLSPVDTSPEPAPAVIQRLRADRGALLDLAAWAGVAVEEASDDARLCQDILAREKTSFEALSTRGLRLLARLRGVNGIEGASRRDLIRRLRRLHGWRDAWRKRRRRMVAALVGRLVESEAARDETAPAARNDDGGFRARVESEGVIAGIAGEIRGAADDYLAQKLDQIEQRVDAKLDDIDRRLAEWRDREVAARLRMLKYTLLASILVALISLGYDYLTPAAADVAPPETVATSPQ
jgi:hypothetical protein